tara:strand:+ start:2897 stop:3940 length:1044 start_codon:yes stop_codon:yes gene_type:complete
MWKEYIDKIPNYNDLELPQFLKIDFLKSFYVNKKSIKHVFLKNEKSFLYSNIFVLQLKKGLQYNQSNFFIKLLLRLVNLKIYFLGNWYLNNFNFFHFNKQYDINDFISAVNEKYSAIVVPDHLMDVLTNKAKYDFIKVEIEEDMIFDVDKNWLNFNDYLDCLKTKYRKKINTINQKSKNVVIKTINDSDLSLYRKQLQSLFDQVVNDNKFSGPQFNVDTLLELNKRKYLSLYGYFENNHLIAFSSYLTYNDNLVSYFVGFDKTINKMKSIYPKILIETIKIAIEGKYNKIIFGRTANEFKSNFGSVPIKSNIYINFKNKFVHLIYKEILKNHAIKIWEQRSPYKTQM